MRSVALIALALLFFPGLAAAVEISTFTNVPFLDGQSLTTEAYVQALYKIAIAAGAILAVLMLMYAGAEYMFSDLITSKQTAKNRIQNALLGLLIILAAVTLLNTINPELTNVQVIGKGGTVTIRGNSTNTEDDVFGKGSTITLSEIEDICSGWVFRDAECEANGIKNLESRCTYVGGTFRKDSDTYYCD